MITFYDFDQDHADGAKGYIRETMYVTNFTTMFLSADTSVQKNFSIDIENGLDTTFASDPRLPLVDQLAADEPRLLLRLRRRLHHGHAGDV